MKAIAIILAAGESKRMGSPKALLEAAQGLTFLGRLAQTFTQAGLAPLVVIGAHAEELERAHPELPAVFNEHWPHGQLSSVQVGLRAALLQGAERILVHPVDAPMLWPQTARQILDGLSLALAAVPTFNGKTGHPLGLQASAARRVLTWQITTLEEAAARLSPKQIPVEDPSILDNLNSPEAVRARFGQLAGG